MHSPTRDTLDRFEDKYVVPLDNASNDYREWVIRIEATTYCISEDTSVWSLLQKPVGEGREWSPWIYSDDTVDEFLVRHQLILGG